MPLLKAECNITLSREAKNDYIKQASSLTSDLLGKPESYVMCSIEDDKSMYFATSMEPAAYIEFKSIGLPEDKTGDLARAICELTKEQLGIPVERIYIEFSNAQRHMWGWNNRTF